MKLHRLGQFFIILLLGLFLYSFGLFFLQRNVNAQEITLGKRELNSVIKVQKNNEKKLLDMPGIVAVGVGLTEDGKPGIHVYLNKNVPSASVAAVPEQVDSVALRIIETDEIRAFDGTPGDNHDDIFSLPVPMGVSTSNAHGMFAGTLGGRVHRVGQPSIVGYVTNNHVAAASGPDLCPAQLNPSLMPEFGVGQCQPGRLDAPDNGCVSPSVGDLVQVIPIIMGGDFENTVDAAFVASGRDLVNKTILDIGNPSLKVQNPAVNLTVWKSGRTTGLTTGKIQTVNATVNVNYGSGCGTAKFVGQIIIKGKNGSFSAAGDSGSLIVGSKDSSGRRKPVGLLFAGSSTFTVANRIGDVLGALGVQIDAQ